MTKRKLALLPIFLLVAGPALAHGPEEHGANQAKAYGEPGDAKADARVIELEMREEDSKMLFLPDTITVAKGEQVRIHLKNGGELDHEFVLGTPDEIEAHADMMRAMPDMVHDDPNAKRLGPKTTGDIIWRFTAAGEFDFACLIPGHMEAGMKGKFIVK